MTSRVRADELGITRRRIVPSTSHRVPPSAVPHSQTWTLSQDANKNAERAVCFATRQLHVKDGTVHNLGPRSKLCSGSHQPSLTETVHLQPSTTAAPASVASDLGSSPAPQLP